MVMLKTRSNPKPLGLSDHRQVLLSVALSVTRGDHRGIYLIYLMRFFSGISAGKPCSTSPGAQVSVHSVIPFYVFLSLAILGVELGSALPLSYTPSLFQTSFHLETGSR